MEMTVKTLEQVPLEFFETLIPAAIILGDDMPKVLGIQTRIRFAVDEGRWDKRLGQPIIIFTRDNRCRRFFLDFQHWSRVHGDRFLVGLTHYDFFAESGKYLGVSSFGVVPGYRLGEEIEQTAKWETTI